VRVAAVHASLRVMKPQAAETTVDVTTPVFMPCLRCGERSVAVGFAFAIESRAVLTCLYDRCFAPHFLALKREAHGFDAIYQRYTQNYPLEFYDEDEDFATAEHHLRRGAREDDLDRHVFSGPIMIYPRKKKFTKAEVLTSWKASKAKCHICSRKWNLNERGGTGWHIDHVIPHIGGGRDTEELANMRVACATCNLKKGRGYTDRHIRCGLQNLIERLEVWRAFAARVTRR
jgi:5-methylcytosine-specific restriction endonuclease McrA